MKRYTRTIPLADRSTADLNKANMTSLRALKAILMLCPFMRLKDLNDNGGQTCRPTYVDMNET